MKSRNVYFGNVFIDILKCTSYIFLAILIKYIFADTQIICLKFHMLHVEIDK